MRLRSTRMNASNELRHLLIKLFSLVCIWRKELSSSIWDCCSSCNYAFVSTTVKTWSSKACARCPAASACCSVASARAQAVASRRSETSICACNLILSSATWLLTTQMPTPNEWFGFQPRTTAKCSTISTCAELTFSWCVT